MSLRLVQPGVLAILVDAGRTRWRSLGVPLGGAADCASLALGNALVGNPPETLALEFTLAGPTIEAMESTACVIFGAPFAAAVNGKPIEPATTFTLEPGDVLRIGGTSTGVRGYLCVAGGFNAPESLGSRSSPEPLGAGEVLPCPASRCEPRGLGFVNLEQGVRLPHGHTANTHLWQPDPLLHVLDGPQRNWFDDQFFWQSYDVLPASNRMGLRLNGGRLTRQPGELASEAVAPGAVQITNDGLPVILGVDGQTIGGYPKIAHVIRADLDRLAQLRPGDRIRFVRVDENEAERLARDRAESLRGWLARLRAADRAPIITNPAALGRPRVE